eukprot:CAMPEP_0113938328 /NCGR_PEP_ID=MMETSP1339-20121228/4764_1 /TAXON_ID=94617 /ORGANISM="Fibrocapsa japonica" /LENGTH=157 /DNA_ID=CAMNT_0000941397 /DNA_START=62 /DNA_END=535 /DNA_ORIENTATION=- /assembly_acc=CAM_ASM_000762
MGIESSNLCLASVDDCVASVDECGYNIDVFCCTADASGSGKAKDEEASAHNIISLTNIKSSREPIAQTRPPSLSLTEKLPKYERQVSPPTKADITRLEQSLLAVRLAKLDKELSELENTLQAPNDNIPEETRSRIMTSESGVSAAESDHQGVWMFDH